MNNTAHNLGAKIWLYKTNATFGPLRPTAPRGPFPPGDPNVP